ncbi:MAG: hypothetical protein LQ345_006470 [Seirophora villosa]|nr:MAG: hypothetical protein LQ345_006470 [Seirophora villosa]
MPQSKGGSVCLAYSGGLDTSIILVWLKEQGYEVVCFMANVGQEEDFDAARKKAMSIGAKKVIIEDLRLIFVEEFCWPAIACNAKYEGHYLLGTSLARPAIARAQIKAAQAEGCFAVSHGCTGKGNDGARFEFAFAAIDPAMAVIAPWRDPTFYDRFPGRDALLDYAAEKGIPVSSTKAKPWSMDENLAHCSYEAGILEDPDQTPPSDMWKLTINPTDAPDKPEYFTLEFTKGIPTKLEYTEAGKSKTALEPVELFTTMNAIARRHGVGRIDIVENRFVGIKSRGCYESPGLYCLHAAHMDLEGLTLDREVRALRDQFVSFNYAQMLYKGFYFAPEREFLHASIVKSQEKVNGRVRCLAFKGDAVVLGRTSESSLYDQSEASMDEMGGFEPQDTTGFIKANSIRLRKYGTMKKAGGEDL